jgi:predicted nucleic acid-binding protein
MYILDSCALIALLAGEPGAENVMNVIQEAIDGNANIKMNQVNLLEVYYHVFRVYGPDEAYTSLEKIKEFPIEIAVGMSEQVFHEAGRIKALYKLPLGDSILTAESIIEKGTIVTADHTDLEKIEKTENVKIFWIREKLANKDNSKNIL